MIRMYILRLCILRDGKETGNKERFFSVEKCLKSKAFF
jgi:hypothetical protein